MPRMFIHPSIAVLKSFDNRVLVATVLLSCWVGRVVKAVDSRSTGVISAWVRTPHPASNSILSRQRNSIAPSEQFVPDNSSYPGGVDSICKRSRYELLIRVSTAYLDRSQNNGVQQWASLLLRVMQIRYQYEPPNELDMTLFLPPLEHQHPQLVPTECNSDHSYNPSIHPEMNPMLTRPQNLCRSMTSLTGKPSLATTSGVAQDPNNRWLSIVSSHLTRKKPTTAPGQSRFLYQEVTWQSLRKPPSFASGSIQQKIEYSIE